MVAGAGWWIAIVMLWPTGSRPYVGGSQTNSIFDLTFGYNGFGRLTGNEDGSVTGGHQAGVGRTGIGRLVDSANGGQIAWLLPAVVILGLAAAVVPPPCPAHRSAAGGAPGVRQLARRDVAGVQLHAGHLPRVLHGRARRADGRRRRRRRRHRVAPPPRGARRRRAGGGDRHHRAVVGDPAAPLRRVERLARAGGDRRRHRRRPRAPVDGEARPIDRRDRGRRAVSPSSLDRPRSPSPRQPRRTPARS